jgi:16S rRNA (uracil1498-N3)-methyltransferase
MPTKRVVLYQAVVKKDNFEWIVEKATELGVTDIVPVITERSEKKDLNMERLNKIAVEASEQCGRGDVPVVHSARPDLANVFVDSVSKDSSKSINGIAFHTEGSARSDLAEGLESQTQSLAVFIGPEGGWSPSELELFHNNKIEICSLGKQVLRAETAAVVALSKVLM